MTDTLIRHRVGYSRPPYGVYFETLTAPTGASRIPVVMVHGGSHTGACWMVTADGRPGWAYRFAERGYSVTVPDWPGHGRSGLKDPASITGELVCEAIADLVNSLGSPVILVTHSMGGAFGWRIAELAGDRVAAIVGVAPAAPGNIQPAGEVLEEDADGWVIRTPLRTGRVRRGSAVGVDRVFVEGKLIGRSTQFPLEHRDSYAASLTATASRLLFERQNVGQSQVRVRDPSCLSGKPILIVTPTEDIDHPRAVDEGVARWLAEQGAKAEFAWLGDRGLVGNGHMVMLERNSEAVADLVLDWMDRLPVNTKASAAPTNLTAIQS